MSHDRYKQAGVDAEKADSLADWLEEEEGKRVKNIKGPYGSVLSGIGGFAGCFKPDFTSLSNPVLVASTDGVGTKLLLAIENDQLHGLGQDLVAMCVNDLYCVGATPLFFIDYFGTGVLEEGQFRTVLKSIQGALTQCGAMLLGGETAELPGLYGKSHFDLAGFVVGVVDESQLLPKASEVESGDILYGFASSGFHSNGFSLIRKWLASKKESVNEKVYSEWVSRLLIPTRIYSFVPELLKTRNLVKAIAHITGGGLSGNIPRVLPKEFSVEISFSSLPMQPWMREFIQTAGGVDDFKSLESVFNMGCGLVAVVSKEQASKFEKACSNLSLEPVKIGEVAERQGDRDLIWKHEI